MRQSHTASEGRNCMQIGFIGAGKVGVALGKYFKQKGQKVGGYYSLSPESAIWAAQFTRTRYYETIEDIISSCDMIFFTVPDDAIKEVWKKAKPFVYGKIIAHCSGLHTSKIFSDIDSTGSSGYSIHPLCAISSRETSWMTLAQILFTIEGDEKNISIIQQMFVQMGNRTRILSATDKAKYHAAASLATNHITALFFMSQKLFLDCGFTEKEAEYEIYMLAKENIEHILKQGCIQSLTGPIERGDTDTVRIHLEIMECDFAMVYAEIAKQLIKMAQLKHPGRNYDEMNDLLNEKIKKER